MSVSVEEIIGALRRGAGGSVRTVASFAASGSEVHYDRRDLADETAGGGFDDISDDLVLEALGRPHQESLYDLGTLQATVRVFDDGTVVVVPASPSTGHVAVVDDACPLPARDLVDRIRTARRTAEPTAHLSG